jgi:excisionase family DNA binding protein
MPTLMSDFPETVTPTEAEARLARESVKELARLLESNQKDPRFRLQRDGELSDPIALPLSAICLLKNILAAMAQGHGVAMIPVNTELTTEQASELLNVSLPYFISLLDEAKIPFRLVGTHRCVRLVDVMAYKARNDQDRLEALDELVAQAQELGMGY